MSNNTLAVAVLGGTLAVNALAADKPNVIFIIADDMFPHMCSFLPEGKGNVHTPNIQKLADEGVVMMNQHVVSPVCTPSRFSCLTGKYPVRATNKSFVEDMAKRDVTRIGWNTMITSKDDSLPKLLKSTGYVTGAVGKNHVIEVPDWVKIPRNADPGQPDVEKKLKANIVRTRKAFKACGFDFAEGIYHHNPDGNGPAKLAVHNLEWSSEQAMTFIDTNKDKPFFLYVALTVPHGPMQDDRSWKSDPKLTPEGILDNAPDGGMPPRETIPERLKAAGIKSSKSKPENLLWMDDMVGALTSKLKQHKLDDNTVIFFFNDHGQRAKGTVYQGGVHNPSIVWKKGGFKCGKVSDALVSNIDFAPTILDLAGAKVDTVFDGKSMLPVLQGKKNEIHEHLYFELGFARGIRSGKFKHIALRYPTDITNWTRKQRQKMLDNFNDRQKKRGKKVHNTDPMKPFSHVSPIPGGGDAEQGSIGKYPFFNDPDQLYDISKDPNEQVNLATNPEYKAKLEEMRNLLKETLKPLPGRFAELK
jgi:arylsulfatase A-like enzyme